MRNKRSVPYITNMIMLLLVIAYLAYSIIAVNNKLKLIDTVYTVQIDALSAGVTHLREENNRLRNELDTLYKVIETQQNVEPQSIDPGMPLTDKEYILVCRVVAAEARGESYEGQLAVAQVIRDRYVSGYYGNTVSEVVLAPYQFAEPWQGDLSEYPSVEQAVDQVFNGYSVFEGNAIYFFNPDTSKPSAVEGIRASSTYFDVIGRHEFRGWHNE